MTAPWRVFYCAPRTELRAQAELTSLGIETFVPFEKFKRHRKRGNVTLGVSWESVPLFPSYVFARTNAFARVALVRGVVAPVGTALGPVAVPEKVLERLRSLCSPDGLVFAADLTKNSFWFRGRVGDTVRVRGGSPFEGFLGTLTSVARLDETGEVSAWINIFGRETPVSLPHGSVDLVGASL